MRRAGTRDSDGAIRPAFVATTVGEDLICTSRRGEKRFEPLTFGYSVRFVTFHLVSRNLTRDADIGHGTGFELLDLPVFVLCVREPVSPRQEQFLCFEAR